MKRSDFVKKRFKNVPIGAVMECHDDKSLDNTVVYALKSDLYKYSCKLAAILSMFFCLLLPAKETRKRIWVLDTTVNYSDFPWLLPFKCNEQYRLVKISNIKHAGQMLSIITEGLDPNKVCFSLVSYTNGREGQMYNYLNSLTIISRSQKGVLFHFSGGGNGFETWERLEFEKISSLMPVVVSAGNEGEELKKDRCNFYPACYDLKNLYVVGGKDLKSSNFGEIVRYWEPGIVEYRNGGKVSGTSASAAVFSNKLLKKMGFGRK